MFIDGESVAIGGVGSNGRRGDVLHPMGQPLFDCPRSPGLPQIPLLPEFFQLTHGADYVGFLFAFDVSAVGAAVIPHTDEPGHATGRRTRCSR